MKRTIKVTKASYVYYGNRKIGYLHASIAERFGLKCGKYRITINKGTQFVFMPGGEKSELYELPENHYRGCICTNKFSKLFFKPNSRKRYDITVNRIPRKKAKK